MRSKGLIILVSNILAQPRSGCYNLFFCHQSGPSLHQWLGQLPLLPWHRQHCFASTIAFFYHITQFNRILELLRLVPLTPTWDTPMLATQAASFAIMAWVAPPSPLAFLVRTTLGSGQIFSQDESLVGGGKMAIFHASHAYHVQFTCLAPLSKFFFKKNLLNHLLYSFSFIFYSQIAFLQSFFYIILFNLEISILKQLF